MDVFENAHPLNRVEVKRQEWEFKELEDKPRRNEAPRPRKRTSSIEERAVKNPVQVWELTANCVTLAHANRHPSFLSQTNTNLWFFRAPQTGTLQECVADIHSHPTWIKVVGATQCDATRNGRCSQLFPQLNLKVSVDNIKIHVWAGETTNEVLQLMPKVMSGL